MNVLNKLKKTFVSALALLAVMVFGVSAAIYAITDAGEVITNIASVDYEDENGNSYTATSNEAEVTVGSVFNATIEADSLAVDAAPGQTVYIPYIITNTGNDTDTYDVSNFVNESDAGAEAADGDNTDNIDGTGLAVYLEETVNGQPDAGEDIITSVEVAAGESAFLVVAITVPSSAVAGNELGVVLTATSVNTTVDDITPDAGAFGSQTLVQDAAGNGEDDLDGTVQGLITVTTGAVLVPTKSSTLDISAGTNGQITYTLTLKNNGGDAVNVDIWDAIPANTTYADGTISFSGLLDRAGTSDDDFMVDFETTTNPNFETISSANFTDIPADPSDNIGGTADVFLPEPAGVDMDGDGAAGEASVEGFFLRDVSLENGVTVSITYTVDINGGLAAGTAIENTFCSGEDIFNDVANTFDVSSTTCSNTVIDTIPQVYGVVADDTDGDGNNTDIDTDDSTLVGDDEDRIDQDGAAGEAIQHEISASVGETVDFRNVITNNGNGDDNFDLSIGTGTENTFPDGTLFTFWDATGSVPLTDDSGNGVPDTGNVAAGASVTVTVRAQLPASIPATGALTDTIGDNAGITFNNNQYFIDAGALNGTWDDSDGFDNTFGNADDERFIAIMTATSVGSVLDADVATASDTKAESLGAIVAAGVDLANATMTDTDGANNGISSNAGDLAFITVAGVVAGVDADETDAGEDDFIANLFDATSNVNGDDGAAGAESIDAADDASDFSTTYNVDVGETFTVNLVVANEAGSPDAFILSAASFATPTANSTQAISGFAAGAPAGWTVQFKNQAGAVITSTPSIPGGSVYAFEAEVTVSSDGTQALDGTDYYLAFAVNSASNGATAPFTDPTTGVADVKVDLVQINAFCSISIIPNGSEQVQPGGTEDFEHTLANDGNSDKIFDLRTYVDTDDAGADDDSWTSTLFVDTTGDDLPDTALAATTTGICYYNAASTQVCTLNAAAPNASGTASITLAPGEQVFLWNRVFAPATAADGAIQTSVVEADVTDTGAAACAADPILATDTATVILGQIRLNKTVAVDTDCDCNSEGLTFTEVAATTVNPGQCVIWRLTAQNEGSVDADNVVINDAVTQFSVIASSGDYTAANPSGNTIQPVAGTARVVAVCESENNGGTPLDCSATDAGGTANMIAKTLTVGDDEIDFNDPTVTFRAGFGATNTAGGTLIPGDVAVAQFCIQVE